MIIEDIYGNEITNPDINVGRLAQSSRLNDKTGEEETIYIYFPFNEEEQEVYDLQTRADSDRDAAICELYEMITEV